MRDKESAVITVSHLSYRFIITTGLAGNDSSKDQNRLGGNDWSQHGFRSQRPRQQCVPLRVPMCHRHRVGYTYTSLPNGLGHSDQEAIQRELAPFDKLIGVKCYSLLPLFMC